MAVTPTLRAGFWSPRSRSWTPLFACLTLLIGLWLWPRALAGAEPRPLRIVAVGDAGEPGAQLELLARTLESRQRTPASRSDAVLYLGDNFYPIGLNERAWERKRDSVLGLFTALHQDLGRENVHAVTGNHDYYRTHVGPGGVGFRSLGNRRAAEIADWTYHYGSTSEAVLGPGPSGRVQVIFFDSPQAVVKGPRHVYASFAELTALLRSRKDDPTVSWRFVAMHHPFDTVGSHGNFGRPPGLPHRIARRLVTPGQDTDSGPNEDFVRRLRDAIAASGVTVQLALAGHDHSLQLLTQRDTCRECPGVQVVSGAGSKVSPVKPSDPEKGQYTTTPVSAPREQTSVGGFAEIEMEPSQLRVRFRRGCDGRILRMGGSCAFRVGADGRLVPPAPDEGCDPAPDPGCPNSAEERSPS